MPATSYPLPPPLQTPSAACTPRRRVGADARRLDAAAPRAAGVKCTAGSNAWPSRVAACAWVQHEVRLASMSRAAGSLSFRFPPQAEPPQLCGPDCRRRPRHQARGPVDECSPGEPPCALLSLRVARGLAVRSSSASFSVQVRWRHGCGLLANGERPCRAHSAEPDIFVAQRAGGEGRLVRRRPVPVASSAEARGDDRHFLSPYLRSLLPCAGVPVASVDSPARITIRARKLPLQAELLERGARLEVEPRRKPRTWWPHGGSRAPRLPPAPRAVARGLHRGRHHLLE